MKTQLLNKIFTFEEARNVIKELIKDFLEAQLSKTSTTPIVKRFELRIEKLDLLSWLTQQNFETKLYGSDQDDNYAIAGVGKAFMLEGNRNVNVQELFTTMRSILTPEYPYLRFYGGLCFDDQKPNGEWENFGSYRFMIPRFELATKDGKMLFACNLVISPHSSDHSENVLQELDHLRYSPQDIFIPVLEANSREDIPSQKVWQAHVQDILHTVKTSVCQKVVLARKTEFGFHNRLDPWMILRQLKKVTPYSYHFCFQFADGTVFLGASPERLYKRQDRTIESHAIAGTRRRGRTHREDEQLRQELLTSDKDHREHAFVVEAIESVLSDICDDFTKDNLNILSLESGHHLLTSFQGKLKENIHDWEILQALHPTPAVGGFPRKEALEIIKQLEPFSRGWYAAPVGYVSLEETEFVVAIRSALVKDNKLTVYAGAGIVEGSEPQSEWNEVENKIGNFLKVLNY